MTTLDWAAYFRAFCELHGEPVTWRGVLLFRDGWTHAAKDHRGPEWPPPDDLERLRGMRLAYWTIRLKKVKVQALQLKGEIEHLQSVKAVRSAVPMVTLREQTDEGRWRKIAKPLDLTLLLDRLSWLSDQIKDCEREIAALRTEHGNQDHLRAQALEAPV